MPTDGWFKFYRSLFRHPLFAGDEACRTLAFGDLIGMAEYEPTSRGIKGHVVRLERGELIASVRFLAERWKWGKGKVQRYMARLEAEKMVFAVRSETDTRSGTVIGTVYRIGNYDLYQDVRDTERDGERDTSGTPAGQIERKKELPTTTSTSSAREIEGEEQQARAAMWEDFNQRAQGLTGLELSKATALVRGIIDGDTGTAWETGTGDRIPWPERPRLMRMALDERTATGGKIFNVLRQLVIPREFDAFKQRRSTDPKPGKVVEGQVNQPADPHAELERLKAENPAVYAEILAEHESYHWWPAEGDFGRRNALLSAMRENLKKPRAVA